jgi:hypothetical protein
MDEAMEMQANLSLREIAIRTKERLLALGFKSPNTAAFFGLEVNKYTTFFYSTETRRLNHVNKLIAEFGDQVNFKFLEPKAKAN